MKIRIKRIEKRLGVLAKRAEVEFKSGEMTKYNKTMEYFVTLEAKLESLIY
jgi:hypothetical protein